MNFQIVRIDPHPEHEDACCIGWRDCVKYTSPREAQEAAARLERSDTGVYVVTRWGSNPLSDPAAMPLFTAAGKFLALPF